jgi:SHS2 domain-containing protein
MRFEFLDHPADIGFRAYGNSPEQLLANCAFALLSIILDPSNAIAKQEWIVESEGHDLDLLLVNWLNEVLFYVDTKGIVFASLEVAFPKPGKLSARALGEPRDPARHPSRTLVKAVTYHQLKIANSESGWLAEVYVDV